jgi:anti-sigma factor RsiW
MKHDIEQDPHRETEELLPWYVTGQLDQHEREAVERHLAGCAQCEKQLRLERRLAEELRATTPDVELGWQRLRNRIQPPPARRNRKASLASRAWRAASRPAVATALAAQLALVVIAGGIAAYVNQPPAYHVLGAAPVPASANLVVVFKPDTREEQLRRLLDSNGASLVGGPTDADAYLLHVPDAARADVVTRLQARPEIVMAEPIDGEVK